MSLPSAPPTECGLGEGCLVAVTGHEGGFVGVHILRMMGGGQKFQVVASERARPAEIWGNMAEGEEVEIGRGNTDPVLTVDSTWTEEGKLRIVCGLAGNQEDVGELREKNGGRGGTVGKVEAEFGRPAVEGGKVRVRLEGMGMLKTCKVGKEGKGKVGVNVVKFDRAGGEEFVVGGWDGRVRVFGWGNGRKPKAVGRGHDGAVRDLAWMDEGGIVSAGEDGKIVVWGGRRRE